MTAHSHHPITVFIEIVMPTVVLVSIALALIAFYTASTPIRILSVALQVLPYIYMHLFSSNEALKRLSLLVFLLCLPFGIWNADSSAYRSLIVPFCFLGGVGCAWFSLEKRKTALTFELPFYGFLALTLFLFIARGYGPGEFNLFFGGIGRNGYSAILFSMCCGYLISRGIRGKKVSIMLVGAAFVCAFPLYGRSSIVAIGILFAASLAARWPRLALFVGICGALATVLGYQELGFLEQLTNFKSGLDSDRWAILDEYASMLNAGSLVLGVPFSNVLSIVWNSSSPDLAIVRLHSYLGFGSILLLFLFSESVVTLFRRSNYLLLMLLVAVLFRASTDVILLFGNVDLFFIPLLLYRYFAVYWPNVEEKVVGLQAVAI